jgi:hypothetical protein
LLCVHAGVRTPPDAAAQVSAALLAALGVLPPDIRVPCIADVLRISRSITRHTLV